MAVQRSIVRREQFEISDKGIRHKPTGYSFTPYPGDPTSGTVNEAMLGSVLPNGEHYRPDDVEEMARRLWLQHLIKN